MADLVITFVSPTHTAAPAASMTRTVVDPPTNSKAVAWSGDRGLFPPARVAGWGLTAAPTPTYFAY